MSAPAEALNARERRRIVHLLDLLCEHEEAVVESCTLDGQLDRKDADSALIALRSRRIWRSAQDAILKLSSEEVAG